MVILIGFVICILRRRRRRRNRARDSILWPPSNFGTGTSFSNLSKVSVTRTFTTDTYKMPGAGWDSQSRSTKTTFGPSGPVFAYRQDEPLGTRSSMGASGLHYHNIRPLNDLRVVPEYRSPTAGLAVTTGQQMVRLSVVSVASSPSLYSDVLMSVEADADSLYEREMGISPGENDTLKTPRADQAPTPTFFPTWPKPISPISELPDSPDSLQSMLDEGPEILQGRGRQVGLLTNVGFR